jgi:hypothetical protein
VTSPDGTWHGLGDAIRTGDVLLFRIDPAPENWKVGCLLGVRLAIRVSARRAGIARLHDSRCLCAGYIPTSVVEATVNVVDRGSERDESPTCTLYVPARNVHRCLAVSQ